MKAVRRASSSETPPPGGSGWWLRLLSFSAAIGSIGAGCGMGAPGPIIRGTSGVIWTEFTFRNSRNRKAVHAGVSLRDEWDRLDTETRTWLLENPGCLVVPSAMSAKIKKDAHGDLASDPHGQVVLSRADHDFIREKAEAAGTIRVPVADDYQFFDTATLPIVREAPHGRHAAASPDEAP